MNAFKTSLIATTIALALGVTAVAAQDTAAAPVRTAGQVVDDAAITASVKAKLLADERTKGFDVNVDTVKGVVTLTGGADSDAAKRAERKERKAAIKEAARLKKEAKQAMRRTA